MALAFTYNANPGTKTDSGRRDFVRLLIGDTDSNDQQLQDAEVDAALAQANDRIYGGASIAAYMIAGLYARRVDMDFEGLSASYAQRQKHYNQLAVKFEAQDKKRGGGLGKPLVGGISIDEMDSVEDNEDRPDPAFRRNQFRNPDEDVDDRDDHDV